MSSIWTNFEQPVEFHVLECATCSVAFAITTDYERRRRSDHAGFYCPSGHSNVYRGDNEADRLRKQLEREREQRTFEREQRDAARQLARTERRRAAAAKGQLTKMRNKVARGECPMAGCGESFSDLHAHVTEQHPELSEVLTDA